MTAHSVSFLLVEDNDLDAEKIERSFADLKITNPLIRARDGLEALSLLRGDHEQTELHRPLIILLDLNMPRMNGIEFLEELRRDERLADLSVYVFTTSDHQLDVQAAHRYNVSGYIVKPVKRAQMIEALGTLNLYWDLCEFPQNGPAT